MNCNCIREIKEQVERELIMKGKKVVRVTVPTELLICENERGAQEVKAVTFSELHVQLEELERHQKAIFIHSYCPYCGTKVL
ncbi:hypothetical protein C8N40_11358 [Pontibacter mucosus]|uniref:Uncharacterized protein n=1 Tax=Pontibacter mucosus TaxID=1649266 RepID=A0A2T5Y9U4_9BACT|nr:hypothetical protein C8N40_11358 [Pontibacter mucosus]